MQAIMQFIVNFFHRLFAGSNIILQAKMDVSKVTFQALFEFRREGLKSF